MNAADRFQLLHGPYRAPPLRRGDRAVCLFRDAEVLITNWSDGRIPWPRCRRADQKGGAGSGLLVDEELARAVRSESSLAIQFWWGVNGETVWRWRRAFGVAQWGTDGSRRLHGHSCEQGARKVRGKRLPPETIERMRQAALADGRRPPGPRSGKRWTEEDLALLGTLPDTELARIAHRFGQFAVSRYRTWSLRNQ